MLAANGLLSKEELTAITDGLSGIETRIDEGNFSFKSELEDIHMNIEKALIDAIGPAGAKLHSARSRNDQIALDLRLYLRDQRKKGILRWDVKVKKGANGADAVELDYTFTIEHDKQLIVTGR